MLRRVRLRQRILSVRPSVCPSVTLRYVFHIGWKSWKLITRTIGPTYSLFVAQTPPSEEHGKIVGRLEVAWEKVACWSTKAAISLTRAKIEEKLLRGPIGTHHQRSFEGTVTNPLRPLFPKIGVRTPPWTSIAIISRSGKVTASNLADTFTGSIPLKICEKMERGRIQGVPNFLGTPYYLRNGKCYGCQIWPVHSWGPSELKTIRNIREKGAWAYTVTTQFFRVPAIISGTGKAMNFKFCTTICRLDLNKIH